MHLFVSVDNNNTRNMVLKELLITPTYLHACQITLTIALDLYDSALVLHLILQTANVQVRQRRKISSQHLLVEPRICTGSLYTRGRS